MNGFNVISLFDGMSCAMIALDRLGIKPDNYFASEIDKYAIQVSKANWPQIKHIGDVTKINYFEGVLYTEFGNYEISFANGLICGGSPCQGFSFAGKQLNFEDPRSKLFFEFVRIYEEIKAEHPDVKVFLENVTGCGIFTEKFKCPDCGKEINTDIVHSVLKSLSPFAQKSESLQSAVYRDEENGIQSAQLQFREKENLFGTEESLLSAEQRIDKIQNSCSQKDGVIFENKSSVQSGRENGPKAKEVQPEKEIINGERSEFWKNSSHPTQYKTEEISRIEKAGRSFTVRETETNGEQVPDLRNEKEFTDRSHNSNHERRQKYSAKFTESLQNLQHNKRQQVNVICDKCCKEVTVNFSSNDLITVLIGVKSILINSALVSAQNRKRLYWTNIPFQGQPADRGILLKHILEYEVDSKYGLSPAGLERGLTKKYSSPKFDPDKTGTLNTKNNSGQLSIDSGTTFVSVEQDDKSLTLTAGYRFNPSEKEFLIDCKKQMIKLGNVHPSSSGTNGEVYSIEGKAPTLTTNKGEGSKIGVLQVGMADDIQGRDQNRRIYSDEGKSPTLIGVTGGHHEPKIAVSYSASIIGRKLNERGVRDDYNPDVPITQCLQVKHNPDKIGCLTTVYKDNVITEMLPGRYEDVYNNPTITYRKLTTTECERLQCVPDRYTSIVSNTQAYKMLGNGWNVDTIVHLFEPLLWLDII